MSALFGTTRALLQAHIDECGQRYKRLDEQQQANHAENKGAIHGLASQMTAMSLQMSNTRIDGLKQERDTAIESGKWMITALVSLLGMVVTALAFVLWHGLPWQHIGAN